MKIRIKTLEEIKIMQEGGKILRDALDYAASLVKPGITTKEIDQKTEQRILSIEGAIPAFKGYLGFPATLCTSVNDSVVHEPPSDYELKEGDIISIDCGVKYKDFYTDSAFTCNVGKISDEAQKLIDVTKESLNSIIDIIQIDVNLMEISKTIQSYVEKNGYSVVRELVGHGIGRDLHEDPQIPNYFTKNPLPNIKKGMTFCIEPMVNAGKADVIFHPNNSVSTKDGSLSAHFELQFAVTERKVIILTQ